MASAAHFFAKACLSKISSLGKRMFVFAATFEKKQNIQLGSKSFKDSKPFLTSKLVVFKPPSTTIWREKPTWRKRDAASVFLLLLHKTSKNYFGTIRESKQSHCF